MEKQRPSIQNLPVPPVARENVIRNAQGQIIRVEFLNAQDEIEIIYDLVTMKGRNNTCEEEYAEFDVTPEVVEHLTMNSNKATIDQKLRSSVDSMQLIVDELRVTLNTPNNQITINAQFMKQNIIRPLVDIAQNIKQINRALAKKYESSA